MIWIDITLMFANLVSVAAMGPTLFDSRTVIPRTASVPKALAATATLPCYFLLGLYGSLVGAFVLTSCWWTVVSHKSP